MKKFLINIAVFFAIVAVVDFSLGKVFYWLQSSEAKGRTQTEYYICNDLKEDILVMGSSRATHHYVAKMISDSLGVTCFNGGQDGNGILLQYGRWKMISKHHLPKVIIYDIEPSFDLMVDDNSRYIDRLKPYSIDRDVNKYIAELFPMERFKMLSGCYLRYDSAVSGVYVNLGAYYIAHDKAAVGYHRGCSLITACLYSKCKESPVFHCFYISTSTSILRRSRSIRTASSPPLA